ncbi:hypothetical protein [Pseudomonas phage D6]|nr:hypothetical protein [Pseudomonas phage D6]
MPNQEPDESDNDTTQSTDIQPVTKFMSYVTNQYNSDYAQ